MFRRKNFQIKERDYTIKTIDSVKSVCVSSAAGIFIPVDSIGVIPDDSLFDKILSNPQNHHLLYRYDEDAFAYFNKRKTTVNDDFIKEASRLYANDFDCRFHTMQIETKLFSLGKLEENLFTKGKFINSFEPIIDSGVFICESLYFMCYLKSFLLASPLSGDEEITEIISNIESVKDKAFSFLLSLLPEYKLLHPGNEKMVLLFFDKISKAVSVLDCIISDCKSLTRSNSHTTSAKTNIGEVKRISEYFESDEGDPTISFESLQKHFNPVTTLKGEWDAVLESKNINSKIRGLMSERIPGIIKETAQNAASFEAIDGYTPTTKTQGVEICGKFINTCLMGIGTDEENTFPSIVAQIFYIKSDFWWATFARFSFLLASASGYSVKNFEEWASLSDISLSFSSANDRTFLENFSADPIKTAVNGSTVGVVFGDGSGLKDQVSSEDINKQIAEIIEYKKPEIMTRLAMLTFKNKKSAEGCHDIDVIISTLIDVAKTATAIYFQSSSHQFKDLSEMGWCFAGIAVGYLSTPTLEFVREGESSPPPAKPFSKFTTFINNVVYWLKLYPGFITDFVSTFETPQRDSNSYVFCVGVACSMTTNSKTFFQKQAPDFYTSVGIVDPKEGKEKYEKAAKNISGLLGYSKISSIRIIQFFIPNIRKHALATGSSFSGFQIADYISNIKVKKN